MTSGDGLDQAWDTAPTNAATLGPPVSPESSRKALSVIQKCEFLSSEPPGAKEQSSLLPAPTFKTPQDFSASISSRFPAIAPLGTACRVN